MADDKKRVFILGAGFSKQAGLPLAAEATPLLLEWFRREYRDAAKEYLEYLQARLAAMQPRRSRAKGITVSFEQLFDCAWFDAELLRCQHQLVPVARSMPGSPWEKGETIASLLRHLERGIAHIFWASQSEHEAHLDAITRFAAYLRSSDTVITFNYDTLVETVLSRLGQDWNHGFSSERTGGVTVLKMHGSLDWVMFPRWREAELQKFLKLYTKPRAGDPAPRPEVPEGPPSGEAEEEWELWRSKSPATTNGLFCHDAGGITEFDYRLGIAGLGSHKPLSELVGSGPIWFRAFQDLKQAAEVYIIGFSFSEFDAMARLHFGAVMQARGEPPARVVLVDPRAKSVSRAVRCVFGCRPEPIAEAAQEVEWGEVLQ